MGNRAGPARHERKQRRRAARLLLACGCVLAAVSTVAAPASAAGPAFRLRATTPGTPGVPQAPATVFSEDFENRQSTLPIRLTQYTGVNGETYTAAQAWLQNCNGWIAAHNDPGGNSAAVAPQVRDCTPAAGGPGSTGPVAWNNVRALAQALGVVNGSADPNANHAVSAYTNGPVNNGNPGANQVEFQTVQPITVPAGGRFLTTSVDAAATSCTAGHAQPQLAFYLVNGTTDMPAFSSPINPCSGGTQVTTGFFAGRYLANSPVLYTGTSAGIKMINQQGSGNGNDHAFDDIKLLDVTPQMDKDFAPGTVQVGATSTLTFTITNTSDLLPKAGWSFTDTLPGGLVLATPASATTSCPAGIVTAASGGRTVSVSGNLAAGQVSCTATVKVTTGTAGTYINDAADITASAGVNPPGSTAVTFTNNPTIDLVKSVTPPTFSDAGQVLSYSFLVTNPNTVAMSGITVTDTDLPGLSAIDCPPVTLNPGQQETCTATYTTTKADLGKTAITNTATAQGTPAGSATQVTSGPATAVVPSIGASSITLVKSASPGAYAGPGQLLFYRFTVTNTSTVVLSAITVTDLPALTDIHCPLPTLDPGQQQICTGTYTTTQADVDKGSVTDTATADGTPPGSQTPVTSALSSATVPAGQNPAITVRKSAHPGQVSTDGQVIHYTFLVQNTGNVTLTGVHVTDTRLPAIHCPLSTLAPGQLETCTATYRTTAADLHKHQIADTATAHGTPPGTRTPVHSAPSTAKVKVTVTRRHPLTPVTG